MTDILLDTFTGDLVITDGDLLVTQTKEDAALQAVTITLKAFRGEWFMNILYGIPYLSNDNNEVQLLGAKDKDTWDGYIREAIINTDYITGITVFDSVVEAGKYKLFCEAVTETGTITIQEEF